MKCFKRKLSLLDELDQEELLLLNSNRTTVVYQTGEFLYKEGTSPFGLMCLNTGKVKVSMTGYTENELIVDLKKPVDLLGLTNLLTGEKYTTSAIALEHSEICIIDLKDFTSVAKKNNRLLEKINEHLGFELLRTHQRMLGLTQKHMRARLADALLFVKEIFGQNMDGSLNMDLKRSDLAALANMTTSNAIRTLSEFVDNQIVSVDRRRVTITSDNQLRMISLRG
ncbi:MAG: Crp/Fnr family transcriptional regulator [Saprospiraceae bacterium]|nr:Crp/Fnr family transcriptional regulator [Saprospiraceae bacterium]